MRHWRKRVEAFAPPPHWTEEMEAACQEAPDERLLAGCPDWLLCVAVFGLLALIVWSSGFEGRWQRSQNPSAEVSQR